MSAASEETPCSWEEAVRWYRAQPENEAAIRANYFDLPVGLAAQRYAASEEFTEVMRLLGPGDNRAALDLGAGNGIASYALASAGWTVTALEPDPSREVGRGAIEQLRNEFPLPISICPNAGDPLPFADKSFDAVFARQVLHHVPDLSQTMREVFRILKPGCSLLALREHVASNDDELAAFLQRHPLHHLYGGENAYPLAAYLEAATSAGFQLRQAWGNIESILNYHPGTESERRQVVKTIASQRFLGVGRILRFLPGFTRAALTGFTRADKTPGRIYSFLFVKP